MSYKGKIRCYIHICDDENFEIIEQKIFEDQFIYNSKSQDLRDLINKLDFDDQIKEELKSYIEECEVELIADIHIEHHKSWTDCGYEYDSDLWLDNVRHQKILKTESESPSESSTSPHLSE